MLDDEEVDPSTRDAVWKALAQFDVSAINFNSEKDAAQSGAAQLEDLPLWPERLATAGQGELLVNLPSDESMLLRSPVVATFYSLRGGVGRSTALAHVARLLAKTNRVICVDMDLEAPGLASLFAVEDQVRRDQGVVPLLLAAEVDGRVPDVGEHLIQVGDTQGLYVLPAGVPDADYARRLAALDPSAWYREEVNPLRLLFEGIRELDLEPDVVLVDSRTGISPISAPLLFEISDVAIVVFFPHPQALAGTRALTRALLGARSGRVGSGEKFTPEPRFVISPIPGTQEVRQLYEDRAVTWLQEWLAPARTASGRKPFDAIDEIVQVVTYDEAVATSDSVESGSSNYAGIAGWIGGFVDKGQTERLAAGFKSQVLGDLRFSSGTAEAQSDDDFEESFLQTDLIARALEPEVPLVIGRKGTGKTALFRRLSSESNAVVVTSPVGLQTHSRWMPEAETYAALERLTTQEGLGWRSLWPCLVGISLIVNQKSDVRAAWLDEPLNAQILSGSGEYSASMMVNDVRRLLSSEDAPLAVWEWLKEMDAALSEPLVLLFDGLDTGFGVTAPELLRRRDALSGLMAFFMARDHQLGRMNFKFMLRDDIWRELTVANKSHLYGRQVRLAWADQTDYLRVAVKQAMRSTLFRDEFSRRTSQNKRLVSFNPLAVDVSYWPSGLVYDAWIWLAGERVSGGKTAFTYNWVWNRLSDANEDHSPRALLQLLNEALLLEKRLERTSVYERSLIRPRALVESLEPVSEQAFEALREEFFELAPVFIALEQIGRTPFDGSELRVASHLEVLAIDAGLLGIDLGKRDDVERYRVPELYRRALRMTRRGQA